MQGMELIKALQRRALETPHEFWAEQAQLIHWNTPFDQVLDYSRPPFSRWFVGGMTNLCYNAVDRHLATRGNQTALIYISTETGQETRYTYADLHVEVQRMAAVLQSFDVGLGDRVLIYMPMIPEAIFAMLATVRLGALHSVVFGGFASNALASRIDDARPKVMLTADAGLRAGRAVLYKHLVDDGLRLAKHPPSAVVIVNRGIDGDMPTTAQRDFDYAALRDRFMNVKVPITWVESSHPSYILYTSGTTGLPKGVQRDTGGYAVALAASMRHIYDCAAGETFFTTSDIGWVVGHSYIVYAPLINGMATVVYEGTPIRPDPGVWWKIIQDHRVSVLFTAPTAVRVLKKQDLLFIKRYDVSSLKHVFLAGEPLDVPTASWLIEALQKPVYDHYWQTETGWPVLTALPGIQAHKTKLGSPSFPAYGFDVRVISETTGAEVSENERGVVGIRGPLPPGCMSTIWGQDDRFVETYFRAFPNKQTYTTFDWGVRDDEGYFFIHGRTDDVINVAGHRLGTREIEEAMSAHPAILEVAVVGVADELKGQIPLAFVVLKDEGAISTPQRRATLSADVMSTVDTHLGAIGRPKRLHFLGQLPKTRSGKILRRAIQAIAEGREPGDLTTLDDPVGIQAVRNAISGKI
jgi:propionyl-CoA synthetase